MNRLRTEWLPGADVAFPARQSPAGIGFRPGQVAILLILAIVAIALATFAALDAFLSARAKFRLQNGGDAAALAAAKMQGDLISRIGRLNIARIIAAVDGDARKFAELELEQRRLALIGPVDALAEADSAARANSLETEENFSMLLRDHVNDIRTMYVGGEGADDVAFPESYPGAWTEYAAAISRIADAGLAVAPDNVEFYYASGNHLLSNRDFYDAIASRNWCWFLFHCENVLHGYGSWRDWGGAGVVSRNTMENSEIFSLHLSARRCALLDVFTVEEIISLVREYGSRRLEEDDVEDAELLSNPETAWFFFDTAYWRTWFAGKRLATDADDVTADFPLAGEVKPIYNILGCSAVVRAGTETRNITEDSKHYNVWTAAAKPFGVARDFSGVESQVSAVKGFVLPVDMEVRLIPVDAAQGGNLETGDIFWVEHLRHHLPLYLTRGVVHDGCSYCLQLDKWEKPLFRQSGITWLKYHSAECFRPVGGRGGTGGTRHAH